MTKATYITFLIFLSFVSLGQNEFSSSLRPYDGFENISEYMSVIYGTFIPRGGFSTGGKLQFVKIRNLESNSVSTMEIKRMKTTKRGDFCFYIRPGNYELIEYIWNTTNGFIATTQTQTITRTNTSADSTANSSQWFRFSVSPSSLIYVGTWQFKEEPISFIDEKDEADKKMKQNYGHFDFSKAKRSVPK